MNLFKVGKINLNMSKISPSRQMIINLSAALLIFVVNFLINFVLSPFIVDTLGEAANGFVQMANVFISYVGVITIALNSMASRFITVSLINGEKKRASEFYSSTFAGNVVLLIILAVPSVLIIAYLQYFIQIPDDLINQVKILFLLIFLSYMLSTATPVWNVATFATNKVYLQSIGTMLSTAVRAVIILLLFWLFQPRVWYLGISAIFSTVILQIWQYYCKNREMKELNISLVDMHWVRIKELLSSGIWNSINQLGVLLFGGLDLILANIFISSSVMGIISIAQIVPNFLGSLQGTITNVFTPNMTILYAKGKTKELVNEIYNAGKINIALLGIPFSVIVVFGKDFFQLWMPSQNSGTLQELSVLYTLGFLLIVGTMPLWNIFVVVNRTRANSLSVIISGIISAGTTIAALEFTNLGSLAICGISSFVSILRNIIFVVPFSAKYLGLKYTTFFPLIGYTVLNFIVEFILGNVLKYFIPINGWSSLLLTAVLFSIISLVFSFIFVLNKYEKGILITKIKHFIH